MNHYKGTSFSDIDLCRTRSILQQSYFTPKQPQQSSVQSDTFKSNANR